MMGVSKVDLGDLGGWISAVAAVLASIVALYIANKNHQREVEAAIDRRREQLDDEARRRSQEAEAAEHRDLDETRRLLVMLRLTPSEIPASPELLGTIIHAVAHHSNTITVDEAYGVLQGWMLPFGDRDYAALNELIENISDTIADLDT